MDLWLITAALVVATVMVVYTISITRKIAKKMDAVYAENQRLRAQIARLRKPRP